MGHQLGGAHPFALPIAHTPQRDGRVDRLLARRVAHGGHRGLSHGRVSFEHAHNLERVHLHASDVDDVVLAASHEEKPLAVDDARIARSERWRPQRRRLCRGAHGVADGHGAALHDELTLLAHRNVDAVVAHDANRHAMQRSPHGAEALGDARRHVVRDGARLRRAVMLVNRDTKALAELGDELLWQGRRAREEVAEVKKRRRTRRGDLAEEPVHRRHAEEHRRGGVVQIAPGLARNEDLSKNSVLPAVNIDRSPRSKP